MWFPFYLTCSVGMVLLNKTLSVNFPNPNTVLGLQNGASVLYLYLGGRPSIGLFDLSVPFRVTQFKPFLFPTINWVIMLALSLKMLQYNSVATMTMFKTLGTLLTCTIEILYFKVKYSTKAKASLGLLAVGSAVYAGTDVGFSPIGYFFATLQISSWVLQTFIEKVATVDSEQTKAGVAVIRNMLSLPVVIALIGVSGEINAPNELMARREIWGQVALSSLFGCGLGLGTSALYKYFAPTTVVVCNNVGKCISIILGCILFKDSLSIPQVIGLATSLAGSFFYGQEEKRRLESARRNVSSGGHIK
jgi:drug/metabolite transporter (DMT)-like permease